MCGIVGITSNKQVTTSIINSLRKLEYRGYDSAGVATLNEGYITTHCDAAAWQKLNIGICLNENNKDFNSGGLYLLDKQENKINVENNLDYGDCFCWIPTIFHGVDIPKLTGVENLNWNSDSGRWQALALTVQSHCIEKRLLSTGYDKFKKDPSKYKEIYRNACKL